MTQVLQGEQRYDLVARYLPAYRSTKEAIENIRLLAPSGERVSLAQLCKVEIADGASEIYREANSRYVAGGLRVRGFGITQTPVGGFTNCPQRHGCGAKELLRVFDYRRHHGGEW